MILVTVGSSDFQFDRLIRGIEVIETDEEILVQHGPSTVRPKGAMCVPYLAFHELVEAVRNARVVITHAGVGSVLVAQMNGKKPIVVPRLARYGEVVDDHQLHFAERLAREEMVALVSDPAGLQQAVRSEQPHVAGLIATGSLQSDLREYLQLICGGER